jgi:predicted ATP-dependent endonuclease of OLD family
MFKNIKIKNLRAITELEIDNLGQVNLFVGENNCGKTTILESLFFLIGATNPILPVRANTFRGLNFFNEDLWPMFFHDGKADQTIEITGERTEPAEQETLLIRPRKKVRRSVPAVTSNAVSVDTESSGSESSFTIDGLELEYSSSSEPAAKIKSMVYQAGGELVTEGVKDRPIRGIFVSPATEFDWKPRFAAVQRRKQVQQVVSSLKQIEPHMADLRLNDIGLLEADMGLATLVPVNLMGGGIARFLSIALAMLDSQNGIVLVDEIENGLYHSSQQKVWKALFSWAQDLNVQVFAATHSYECIKAFSNSMDASLFGLEPKLFRIERKDEKFRAVEYTKELLAESLESNWEVR